VKFATSDPEEPPKDAEETLTPMPNPPSAVGMELGQLEGQDGDGAAPRSSRDGRSIPRATTVAGVTEVGGDVPLGNEGEKKNANDRQVPQLRSDGSGEESVVEEQRQPVVAAPVLRVGTDVGEGPSYPSPSATKEIVPDAIGRETCPICIVDFEEGDDLRLLPCEGKHRFHQNCVDPWLLELSSSCPICRQGRLLNRDDLVGGADVYNVIYRFLCAGGDVIRGVGRRGTVVTAG
jgi:Ring finger domain